MTDHLLYAAPGFADSLLRDDDEPEKPFALFAGFQFYPEGGWDDFVGCYETLPEASSAFGDNDWWHVVDLRTQTVVARGTNR